LGFPKYLIVEPLLGFFLGERIHFVKRLSYIKGFINCKSISWLLGWKADGVEGSFGIANASKAHTVLRYGFYGYKPEKDGVIKLE
jgi:hypothetical protein